MAGGIDWFRWHHGSVTDPKFGLIAKKAGARVGDVLAIWAFVLESASANESRGTVGPVDAEALEFLLDLEEGTVFRVLDAMTQRGLLGACGVVNAWEKRQPKREREDSNSTERVRAFRERQRQEEPGNATKRQETPRGEESREEGIEEANASSRRQPKASDVPNCPYQSIADLYMAKLPELPGVRVMDEKRKRCIKAFWVWVFTAKRSDGQVRAQTADQALTWIGQYFDRAKANDFVMGRAGRTGEHANWRADIEYLCGEKGRKQVIERTEAA